MVNSKRSLRAALAAAFVLAAIGTAGWYRRSTQATFCNFYAPRRRGDTTEPTCGGTDTWQIVSGVLGLLGAVAFALLLILVLLKRSSEKESTT